MPGTDERSAEVFRRTRDLITAYLRLQPDELRPESHIVDDLGADSLALVELGFQISETFGVPMLDTSGDKLVVRHLVEHIVQHLPPAGGGPAPGTA
jgi:acyl carrier protein